MIRLHLGIHLCWVMLKDAFVAFERVASYPTTLYLLIPYRKVYIICTTHIINSIENTNENI